MTLTSTPEEGNMSDPVTPAPRPKFALGPLLIALLVGGLIVFFISQAVASNSSPDAAPPAAVETTAPSADPEPAEPSATPSATPTVKPLLPAAVAVREQLGGIEFVPYHSDAPNVPVPLSEANRVRGPYSPDVSANSFCGAFETAGGWMSLTISTNNETDGLIAILNGC